MASDVAKSASPAPKQSKDTNTTSSGGGSASGRSVQLKASLREADGYDAQAALLTPVQRHGGGEDAGSVHQAAAHGVSGSGGSLPYASQIQNSFGRHDVSGVKAHVGGAAREASDAMGANAYATGNAVAFKGAPDLHTVAHEAAHVVQQKAGVSLSGGVGKAGDSYENHADRVAGAVVAGKSAEPILDEMAGKSSGGGSVQRQAVQREASTTPHADAALTQVGAGASGNESTSAEQSAPQRVTVPRSYDSYCAHIRVRFADDLQQLRTMQAEFARSAKGAHAKYETLSVSKKEMNDLEAKYEETGGKLERADQIRRAALAAMAPHDGKTIAELHAEATALIDKHKGKKIRDEEDKNALEAIMYSTMELQSQLDPDAGEFGRELYQRKIDKEENARLVTKADSEGLPPAESAELAVNYRTWARVFVRTEIMTDDQAAEILFMRDLGKSGRQAGESPASIMAKVFNKMKADKGIDPETTFDSATEEQRLLVYQGMIDSAKKTNATVDNSMTGRGGGTSGGGTGGG